jgi:uncharacterized protein (TIGR02145 family)
MKKLLYFAMILSLAFIVSCKSEEGRPIGEPDRNVNLDNAVFTFTSDSIWTVTNGNTVQFWSDAVTADSCEKRTTFIGAGLWDPITKSWKDTTTSVWAFNADCRSNPNQKGDLFSWRAVEEYKNKICPDGWRVPSSEDFRNLDMILGGTGGSRWGLDSAYIMENYVFFNGAIRNPAGDTLRLIPRSAWGGNFSGRSGTTGILRDQFSTSNRTPHAYYWSLDDLSDERAVALLVGKDGVNPQSSGEKSNGFAVRCVTTECMNRVVDTAVCDTNLLKLLMPISGASSYSWSTGETTQSIERRFTEDLTTLTATATVSPTCQVVYTFHIRKNPRHTFTASVLKQTVGQGENITNIVLTPTGGAAGFTNLRWGYSPATIGLISTSASAAPGTVTVSGTEIGPRTVSGNVGNNGGTYILTVTTVAAAGNVCPTITTTSTANDTIKITVSPTPITGVTLNYTEYNLRLRDTFSLIADVQPANATDRRVTYTSFKGMTNDNTRILRQDIRDASRIIGQRIGVDTIRVVTQGRLADGITRDTAYCIVTVDSIPVESIVLPTNVNLYLAGNTPALPGTLNINATVLPTNANNQRLNWISLDPTIVSVDANGTVTALRLASHFQPITARIMAVSQANLDITANTIVTVNPIPITGITLNRSEITLAVGEEFDLITTILPLNASNKGVTWRPETNAMTIANNPATVNSSGRVLARRPGRIEIVARSDEDNNKTASCWVTVVER